MYPQNEYNKLLAKRIFLNNLEECQYFPKYLQIETIHGCNSSCVMCAIKKWTRGSNGIMKQELFEKIASDIGQYKDWIEFVGLFKDGEPTLDKNLCNRVKLLKDIGIKRVGLCTNAQLLNENVSEELIKNGIDEISVSFHSLNKETFKKIQIGLDYDEVLKNILDLIKVRNSLNSNLTIRIRRVEIDENSGETEQYINFWKTKLRESDRAYSFPYHNWGNLIQDEKSQLVKYYADKPCVSPFSTMVINFDGKVPLCCIDCNNSSLVGDITHNNIKEIWTGEIFSKIRNNHANSNRNILSLCRGCNVWDK